MLQIRSVIVHLKSYIISNKLKLGNLRYCKHIQTHVRKCTKMLNHSPIKMWYQTLLDLKTKCLKLITVQYQSDDKLEN